jgi:hypothetical protein
LVKTSIKGDGSLRQENLIDNFDALLKAFLSFSKRKSPFKRNGYHGDYVEQPSKSYNMNLMRSSVFLIQL